MSPNLESEFKSMMAASYGRNWQTDLAANQIVDMRRSFMGGAQAVLSQIPLGVAAAVSLRAQCEVFLRGVKAGDN